jgi:hypothetical protein
MTKRVFIYVFLLFGIMYHCLYVPRKAGKEVERETGQLLCAPTTMVAHSIDGFSIYQVFEILKLLLSQN